MVYDTYIAANTEKGFSSFFEELIRDKDIENVYLIKGGPGCGKSTFMKKVAEHFKKQNHTIEQIHCSSDPESLDGIKIEGLKTVIIDATAPHSFDMKYPGVKDNIIDLSVFWDENILKNNKNEIISLFDEISNRYKSVYSTLKSAGTLLGRQMLESECNCDIEKVNILLKKIVKQNAFTPIVNNKKLSKRYLSAINCQGTMAFDATVSKLCDNCIVLDDELSVSGVILSKFLMFFRKSGYDVDVYYNPLCPTNKIDHIILRQFRFGIFTNSTLFPLEIRDEICQKRINTKKLIDKEYSENNKNKISLRKKLISQLLDGAVLELMHIKQLHDKLETYYIDVIDYKKLSLFTDNFIIKLNGLNS